MSETVIDMRPKDGKEWIGTKIDLSKPIEPPEPLLTQEETGCSLLFRRGIHIVSGKQKAGKTFYNSIIMAALLNPDGFCGLKPTKTTFRVLFADTEQDRSDTFKVVERIHRLNGWQTDKNYSKLVAINLREFSAEERLKLIEQALSDYKPDILIIDGVVDLCMDFNSLEESHALTTKLMKWTVKHDVSIVTAIHINKGNDELRGHLGAFLAQKSDSVIRISKESDGIAYMGCKVVDSRKKPIEDFNFRIVEGLPEPYDTDGKVTIDYHRLFEDILRTKLKYNDLVAEVQKSTGKAIATAKRYITSATELKIITSSNGYYECESSLPF
jgi:hypothetical protein